MGADADAHLFFGVDFGENSPLIPRVADGEIDYDAYEDDDFDPGDLKAWIQGTVGIKDRRGDIEVPRISASDEYTRWKAETPEGRDYTKALEEFEAAMKPHLDRCPVEIVTYGYTMDIGGCFALAIRDTHERYWWDHASPLRLPAVGQEEVEKAKAWCAENGIVAPKVEVNEHGIPSFDTDGDEQEWTWRLTASYG